jgi:DNA-binding NarL/FixJ family response regulator
VFVLDDHELIRQGIREFLAGRDDLAIVGEAGNAADALRVVEETRPDVAVLDISLGNGSGIDVCRTIRERFPRTQCLMLTSRSDDGWLSASKEAGAAAFILKRTPGLELLNAIRGVAAGRSLLEDSSMDQVMERVRRALANEPIERLTRRERKVFDLMSEGLANRQIAERMGLAEQTVKNYVSSVLGKLNLKRRAEVPAYAARLREREGVGTP